MKQGERMHGIFIRPTLSFMGNFAAVVMLLGVFATSTELIGQTKSGESFRAIVERIFLKTYKDLRWSEVCPRNDPAAERVFADYGAMFVAKGVEIPWRCILNGEKEVRLFQSRVKPEVASINGVQVTLQKAALSALLNARKQAAAKGLSISPRGGSTASTRSYSRTLELWKSRFDPALAHWVKKGRIKRDDAAAAQNAEINEQVAMVLAWEAKGLFFSTDFSKSILYSVAVPGASQHNFMLALDVEQYANIEVRQILAENGWFQTVKSDLPHFTFLGVAEKQLPRLGLDPWLVSGQKFWIPRV